jgi:biopolymer transport protein ExbB/TolQ
MSTAGIRRYLQPVVTIIIVSIVASRPNTVTACPVYEPTLWEVIETMNGAHLAGMLLLLSQFALLAILGVRCGRAILRAGKQTRDYESQALSALYYNQVERAISVGATCPASPMAAVVTASLERSRYQSGDAPLRLCKLAFQRTVVEQTASLKRKLWVLSAIGWSSPIIGLATMLLPTQYERDMTIPFCFGLLIAALAVWLHKWLSAEVDILLQKTDRVSLSIVEQIVEQTAEPIDKQKDHRALFGSCDRSSNSITISGSVLPTLICKPSSSTRTI